MMAFLQMFLAAALTATHVLTADYLYGNGGADVPAATVAPYLSWVADPKPSRVSEIHAAGMRAYSYVDPNRVYQHSDDLAYHLVSADPTSQAKTCSGGPVTTPAYGGGLLTDPRSTATARILRELVRARSDLANHAWDAYFVNDVTGADNLSSDPPCNYDQTAWVEAKRRMLEQAGAPLIANGLSDEHTELKLAEARTVRGLMHERCYGFHGGFGIPGDGAVSLDHGWLDIADAELTLGRRHVTFWCFDTAQDGAGTSSALALRLFTYASFLLTYDPATAVFESAHATPSKVVVMPETGFVALDPLVSPPNASALRTSSGVFVREYRDCRWRGRKIGACAVAVNPDAGAAHAVALRSHYSAALKLSGSGVLDGGTVGTDAPPGRLEPLSAAIFVRGKIVAYSPTSSRPSPSQE